MFKQHNYFLEIKIILIDWNSIFLMQLHFFMQFQIIFMSKKAYFVNIISKNHMHYNSSNTGDWTQISTTKI